MLSTSKMCSYILTFHRIFSLLANPQNVNFCIESQFLIYCTIPTNFKNLVHHKILYLRCTLRGETFASRNFCRNKLSLSSQKHRKIVQTRNFIPAKYPNYCKPRKFIPKMKQKNIENYNCKK